MQEEKGEESKVISPEDGGNSCVVSVSVIKNLTLI